MRRVGPEGHDAEPIPPARGEMPDRHGDTLGDISLPAIGRPELHRCRRIESQPRHEHPLREIDANVGFTRASRDVPVDSANVVAGGVRANHRELGASP